MLTPLTLAGLAAFIGISIAIPHWHRRLANCRRHVYLARKEMTDHGD